MKPGASTRPSRSTTSVTARPANDPGSPTAAMRSPSTSDVRGPGRSTRAVDQRGPCEQRRHPRRLASARSLRLPLVASPRGPGPARTAPAPHRRPVGRRRLRRPVRGRLAVDRGGRRPRVAGHRRRRRSGRGRRPRRVRRGALAPHPAGGAGRGAAPRRRVPAGPHRRHRPRHRDRDGLRHQPGAHRSDRDGRPGLRLLRRPPRHLRARAHRRHRRPGRAGGAGPGRRGRGHRPVERAGDPRGVEDGAGPRGRVHRRAEAPARGAAQRLRVRRGTGRGRRPRGCDQRDPRWAGGRRAPGGPPRHRQGRLHRLDRRRQADHGPLCRAGDAGVARAGWQVGRHRVRRRRPRRRRPSAGRWGHAPVGPGVRRPHPRPGGAVSVRRGGRGGRCRGRGRPLRRPPRPRHGDGAAGRRAPARPGRGLHRLGGRGGRPDRHRRGAPGPPAPRLVRPADDPGRRAQRHAGGPRGDLRPGAVVHPLRRRGRRRRHRQRLPLRPVGRGVGGRRRAGRGPRPADAHRQRRGQRLLPALPARALRRAQGVGPRARARPRGPAGLPRAAQHRHAPVARREPPRREHAGGRGAQRRVAGRALRPPVARARRGAPRDPRAPAPGVPGHLERPARRLLGGDPLRGRAAQSPRTGRRSARPRASTCPRRRRR